MLALNGVAVTYANGTQALKTTTLTFNQGQFVVCRPACKIDPV